VNSTALRRYVKGGLLEEIAAEGQGAAAEGLGGVQAGEEASLEDLVAVVAESNTKKELRCPDCAKPMKKDRFHPMIPITVDLCKKCERMWLDAGEMNLLKQLYREMARSTDPNVVRVREKVAMVNSDMATSQMARDEAREEANLMADGMGILGGLFRALLER
jgi:Zn-finger nucleic acid-binding protein